MCKHCKSYQGSPHPFCFLNFFSISEEAETGAPKASIKCYVWQNRQLVKRGDSSYGKVTLRAFRDACCVHARENLDVCNNLQPQPWRFLSLSFFFNIPSSQYTCKESRWAEEHSDNLYVIMWATIRERCLALLWPFPFFYFCKLLYTCAELLAPLSISSSPAIMHNSCNQNFATVQNCVPHILCVPIGFP